MPSTLEARKIRKCNLFKDIWNIELPLNVPVFCNFLCSNKHWNPRPVSASILWPFILFKLIRFYSPYFRIFYVPFVRHGHLLEAQYKYLKARWQSATSHFESQLKRHKQDQIYCGSWMPKAGFSEKILSRQKVDNASFSSRLTSRKIFLFLKPINYKVHPSAKCPQLWQSTDFFAKNFLCLALS